MQRAAESNGGCCAASQSVGFRRHSKTLGAAAASTAMGQGDGRLGFLAFVRPMRYLAIGFWVVGRPAAGFAFSSRFYRQKFAGKLHRPGLPAEAREPFEGTMPARRFPPPWTVEDIGAAFVVKGLCKCTAKACANGTRFFDPECEMGHPPKHLRRFTEFKLFGG
jgi:hypothetical protein